jgi:hypothetical protein
VKVVQQAGKAAPAVAVIGALASAPQILDDLSAAPAPVSGHHQQRTSGAAHTLSVASLSDRLSEDGTAALSNAGNGQLAQAKARTYRARHSKPTDSGATDSKPSHHSTHHRASRTHAGPRCSGSSGMLPANYAEIVTFLSGHGYSPNAVAGIAGNIYQESKGDPESVGSGGGGLIGWTPLPSGFVTGNPATDLQTQLAAILTYNQGWGQYIPALNDAGSPAQAADIYVTDFERAGIPATSNREAAANAVAQACGL